MNVTEPTEPKCEVDRVNHEEEAKYLEEDSPRGKEAYDRLLGAIGNDFISTVSVLHHVHKKEKINQLRMSFDTNDDEIYEIFIVRDREKRLGKNSLNMDLMFDSKTMESTNDKKGTGDSQ